MAEQVNLTTPDFAVAGTSVYRIRKLCISVNPAPIIDIILFGDGFEKRIVIEGAEAGTLITQINTADFRTISFRRRLLQFLVDTGRLIGTVTG